MAPDIQAELKQSKPFSSLEEEATLALERTADLLQRRFDELFKTHSLSGTQYNVLRILRGAGPAGLTCGEIAERMINRDPDITRLLDRIERRGLCLRKRHSKDRRVMMTTITPKGLDLLRELDVPTRELHRKLLSHMGETRLRSMLRLLQEVRDSTG